MIKFVLMGVVVLLILTEIITPIVLWQHFYKFSGKKFYISLFIHLILSIWLWILVTEAASYRGIFDTARHIWLTMNMAGMMCAVLLPRLLLIFLHFAGKLIKFSRGEHLRWLTNTGITLFIIFISILALATFHGRFNFETEAVTIKIKGLNKDFDGLKIAQLSDMHLAAFYNHEKLLEKVVNIVNSQKPDLILNTGDFISFGWREFGRNDTIFSKLKSRYGSYAVMGNHDFGTYNHDFTEADRADHVLIMKNLIESSGYTLLIDENRTISIGNSKIGLIGVITMGSHPNIKHGDVVKSMAGLDSVDFKILLSHDPNQWVKDVASKTDIDLTLSGHTHGMQMGIYTKNFRWSPAKYFYPHWNGLFSQGKQFHYVNRGLGVLAIPFRIWMPPEITLITLRSE